MASPAEDCSVDPGDSSWRWERLRQPLRDSGGFGLDYPGHPYDQFGNNLEASRLVLDFVAQLSYPSEGMRISFTEDEIAPGEARIGRCCETDGPLDRPGQRE